VPARAMVVSSSTWQVIRGARLMEAIPRSRGIFGIALGLFTAGSGLMNLKYNLKTPMTAVLDHAPWHVLYGIGSGFGSWFL
jgi:hypothetical protein